MVSDLSSVYVSCLMGGIYVVTPTALQVQPNTIYEHYSSSSHELPRCLSLTLERLHILHGPVDTITAQSTPPQDSVVPPNGSAAHCSP